MNEDQPLVDGAIGFKHVKTGTQHTSSWLADASVSPINSNH